MTFSNDLKLDAAGNRAFVLNRGSSNNLMVVDLTSGDRTIISGAGVGSGQEFLVPWHIEHDVANDRVFIFDLAVTGVLVVDLSTGERAVMSK
jgi:DNA-binding beta-propeller fold protein YncE